MSTGLLSFAALACGAGALALAPRLPGALPELGRDLTRPFVIPSLWNGLAGARREGSAAEVAERARTLLALLPEWGDGHVHFAAMLAFEAGRAAGDPEVALDRLMAGVAWLEQSAQDVPALAPDLYASIASFLEIRCGEDRGLAKAFEARFSRGAVVAADAWLARAESLVPLPSIAKRRAWLALRQVASALRLYEDSRALEVCELALRRLAAAPDAAGLEEWHEGLTLARAAIAGTAAPEGLAAAPILDEVMRALVERRKK
jgi:hypothetical protein